VNAVANGGLLSQFLIAHGASSSFAVSGAIGQTDVKQALCHLPEESVMVGMGFGLGLLEEDPRVDQSDVKNADKELLPGLEAGENLDQTTPS